MIKLPLKIKVGSLDYNIEEWDKEEADQSGCYGSCSAKLQTIRVDVSLGDQRTSQTFLHELLHAIFCECASSEIGVEDKEEMIVSLLSKHLISVFRDNKDILQYFIKAIK